MMNRFVDYKITLHHKASSSEVAKAISSLMSVLHAGFSEIKGDFALAFPDLEANSAYKRLLTFRVFSNSRDNEESLIEFVRGSTLLEGQYSILAPRTVPSDFSGEYKSYSRVRIKSRERAQCRFETMTRLMSDGSHWIDIVSKSNGGRFRMYINVKKSSVASSGSTNSYGLSIAEEPVFLPAI